MAGKINRHLNSREDTLASCCSKKASRLVKAIQLKTARIESSKKDAGTIAHQEQESSRKLKRQAATIATEATRAARKKHQS